MKIKTLIATLVLASFTYGCALIPKPYVENKKLATGDLEVEIKSIHERGGVTIGHVVYYPPDGSTMFSVYLSIVNKSKKNIKSDLSQAFVVEGKRAIGYSMLLQAKQFQIIDEMEPVKVLEPGEEIVRNLIFLIPKNQVPDGFIWKGVGAMKIPQTLPTKDEGKKG